MKLKSLSVPRRREPQEIVLAPLPTEMLRSLYLSWMTGLTPMLSPTTTLKDLASLSTIDAATMRLCRADLPATAHSSRLPRPFKWRGYERGNDVTRVAGLEKQAGQSILPRQV